jgi:hypothetical protein
MQLVEKHTGSAAPELIVFLFLSVFYRMLLFGL